MRLVETHRSPSRTAPAVWSIALVGALLLAACSGGGKNATPPVTTAKTTGTTADATTTTTTVLSPSTTTSTTVVSPTTQPPSTLTYAPVTGTYYGGTADQGWLYIRSDGASRYRYPDDGACQCSTSSAPIANVDFSLTSLVATSGGHGHYRATGRITAESDPVSGRPLAGPIGSAVTVTIGPAGSAMVSFLPSNIVLMIPGDSA